MTQIIASKLADLIGVLYTLCIAYNEGNKVGKDVSDHMRDLLSSGARQQSALPSLPVAVRACMAGRNNVEALVSLGTEIRENWDTFYSKREYTAQELDVLKALGLYLRSDSEPAWAKLVKMARISGDVWVAHRLDKGFTGQDTAGLESLVKKLSGHDGNALTLEESKAAKEKSPELYQQYLALRQEFTRSWRDAIASCVRQSHQNMLPMPTVEKWLAEQGIQHNMPKGFTGYIDDQCRWYDKDKKLIDGVPSAVMFPKVVMNKAYGTPDGGAFVFTAVGSNVSHFYTLEFKQRQARAKFDAVIQLAEKLPSIRKRWFQYVKAFNPESARDVCAVVLEVLWRFSARIGSAGNKADGKSTYGIATLKAKHATITASGDVILKYPGKDGIPTRYVVKAADPEMKFVAEALYILLENKDPKINIFTWERPTKTTVLDVPITPTQVNQLFHACGAHADVTVHKMRTAEGTRLMKEQIDELSTRKRNTVNTERDAMNLLEEMAKNVGKTLNHVRRTPEGNKVTGATALANYVDPLLVVTYFESFGFRPPKFIERLIAMP